MSRFRAEIEAQPAIAALMLEQAVVQVEAAAAALRERRPAGLMIAARGSSDHAATYAKYLFESRNRLPVALAAPSLFGLYHRPPRIDGFAVLAISQSGASPDVAGVVEEARRQRALTIAITGPEASQLSASAEHLVHLRSGPELSVPASKTYTASLLAVAMLSHALDPEAGFGRALARVPRAMAQAVRLDAPLSAAAGVLRGERLAVLGRGYNLATALEVGLKLAEICYVAAEARSVAEFLHGPVAAVEPGFRILMIEASGPTLRQMRDLGRRVTGQGARLVTLTDRPAGALGTRIPVLTGLPEALTPLPFAVAGQLLAVRMAESLGHDSDHPRGLRKVTQTR